MKLITYVFAFVLFGCLQTTAFAQKITKQKNLPQALSLSLPQFNISSNGVGLRLGGFKLHDPKVLTLYNRTSGINDIFSPVYKDGQVIRYERRGSIILLENEFRTNKIDSFNPYGADSLGQGLLVGVLNLLF